MNSAPILRELISLQRSAGELAGTRPRALSRVRAQVLLPPAESRLASRLGAVSRSPGLFRSRRGMDRRGVRREKQQVK